MSKRELNSLHFSSSHIPHHRDVYTLLLLLFLILLALLLLLIFFFFLFFIASCLSSCGIDVSLSRQDFGDRPDGLDCLVCHFLQFLQADYHPSSLHDLSMLVC